MDNLKELHRGECLEDLKKFYVLKTSDYQKKKLEM